MIEAAPLVSVLMTIYNKEKYLSEAIRSVLDSSFNDFELLLVDDGSVDGSRKIMQEFAAMDSRIRFHFNEQNLGDYHNRNLAASLARGKYIKYLDADDVLYPWTLKVMSEHMERHPMAAYGLDSLEPDLLTPFPLLLDPQQTYNRHYFTAPVFHKAPSSSIIRRDLFFEEGGFSGKRFVGDLEFWMKLSRKHFVLLMPQGMVWARSHEGQESKLIWNDSNIVFQYLLTELAALKHDDCPMARESGSVFIKRVERAMARSAFRSLLIDWQFSTFRQKQLKSGIGFVQMVRILLSSYA